MFGHDCMYGAGAEQAGRAKDEKATGERVGGTGSRLGSNGRCEMLGRGEGKEGGDDDMVEEKIKKLDDQLMKYKEQIRKTRPGAAQDAIKRRAIQVSVAVPGCTACGLPLSFEPSSNGFVPASQCKNALEIYEAGVRGRQSQLMAPRSTQPFCSPRPYLG
eukprot:1152351-Pelagomonas_calceolata.AAC.1